MVRNLDNERFKIICSCRPAQPTYQPNMKKWDNIGNFWPIKLKFGMQVPFTGLVTIQPLFHRQTRLSKKLPMAKFSNCHILSRNI